MIKYFLTICLVLAGLLKSYAQSDSLTWEEKFALLEAEMDSMSIFYLLDSILASSPLKYSEFNARMSYNSNVLNAGRNYGVNQHSISPGMSYYHSTGLYADYAGFWNSQTTPEYNLSIFSFGYLGSFSKKWNYSLSYERWWYHQIESTGLNNNLGGNITYRNKLIYATIDYSLLFGERSAHRLIGSLSGNVSLGKWWCFKSIKLLPSLSSTFGNSLITTRFEGDIIEEFRSNQILRTNFRSDEFQSYVNTVLSDQEKEALRQIRESRNLTTREKITQQMKIYLTNDDVLNYLYALLDTTEEKYGIMNYNFSLPLMLVTEKFSFLISYTYSVPVQLPDEDYALDPVGYFGASVIYRIPFNYK